MSNPRCILLEPAKMDVSDAAEFGKIVYLFESGEPRPSIFKPEFLDTIADRLDKVGFNPENDFFVATGYLLSLLAAVHVLTRKYGEFRILGHYAPSHSYCELEMGYQYETDHQGS